MPFFISWFSKQPDNRIDSFKKLYALNLKREVDYYTKCISLAAYIFIFFYLIWDLLYLLSSSEIFSFDFFENYLIVFLNDRLNFCNKLTLLNYQSNILSSIKNKVVQKTTKIAYTFIT